MRYEMTMPDLSTAGSTVRIMRWLVEKGQKVQRGQPLMEVETDKATMEVEAAVSGVINEILVPEETEAEVGQVIAVLDTQEAGPAAPQPESKAAAPVTTPQPSPIIPPPAGTKPGGMFARNRQKAEAALEPTPASPPAQQAARLTASQRVVGQRMQESKATIPHYYLQSSANAGALIARRRSASGEKTAWDAYFVYAAALALQKYPRLKTQIVEGALVAAPVEAVGVAVDLEGDLFVISITSPEEKTPETISTEIRTQVQRVKEGSPEARKIRPNALTISNLGASGVEAFTAIINPPEAAILAVGKIAPVVVALDGQPVIQERVTLTLSVDHRIANGRYAADFLAEIIRVLETLS